MSGETEAQESGWTVDTLKAHYDGRLAEMDLRYQQRYDAQRQALDAALLAAEKAVQTALTAAEKAVAKAETAAEKRFEAVNEFRGQLADQAATLVTRVEFNAATTAQNEKIEDLKTYRDQAGGARGQRAASQATILVIAAVVGILMPAIIFMLGYLLRK